jgi:hypothetical protein
VTLGAAKLSIDGGMTESGHLLDVLEHSEELLRAVTNRANRVQVLGDRGSIDVLEVGVWAVTTRARGDARRIPIVS